MTTTSVHLRIRLPHLLFTALLLTACDSTGPSLPPPEFEILGETDFEYSAGDSRLKRFGGWARVIDFGPDGSAGSAFVLDAERPSLFSEQPSLSLDTVLQFRLSGEVGTSGVEVRLRDAEGRMSDPRSFHIETLPVDAFWTTSGSSQNFVSVSDVSFRILVDSIPFPDGGVGPLLRHDEGDVIWVVRSEADRLTALDPATAAVVSEIALTPGGLPLIPDFRDGGTELVVPMHGVGEVWVVDLETGVPTLKAPTLTNPVRVAVTPDGRTAVVSHDAPSGVSGGTRISFMSLETGQMLDSMLVGGRERPVLIEPDGQRAWIPTGTGDIPIVDLTTFDEVDRVTLASHAQAMMLSPDGSEVYVARAFLDEVDIVDLASREVKRTISDVPCASGFAPMPDGRLIVHGCGMSIVTPATGESEFLSIWDLWPPAFAIYVGR